MKTLRPWTCCLALLLTSVTVVAAPLAWFPGPTVDPPFSGAATAAFPGLGNVLIGGDGYAGYFYPLTYPEYLTVTNAYWTYLPPLDSLNIGAGAVSSGGVIIFYGGTDGTNVTSATTGYSPSGDAPLTLAPMSVARAYFGYAPDANGNAYAIGGLDANGQPLASAECFNLDLGASGAWSAIASLPLARYNFPAVFDQTNQIYIFGGLTNPVAGGEIASVLRYSVTRNTWTNLAPMPVPTAGSCAVMGADGKIYVAGGMSGGSATDVVQIYDPTSNSWAVSTPLPEALTGAAMGVDSLGRLLVMGGTDVNGNDVGDVWRSQSLNEPDSAPVVTQFPGTNAVYLAAYASSLNATGSPPPTYTLVTGPAGMQVNHFSGAITWTPQGLDQIGAIPVTVLVTNYAGTTNYAFTINVPNPPPATPTNLAVVGVTENSVTLSWSPADPAAGAVTYSVWLRHVIHDPKGSGGTVWYSQIGSSTTDTNITISGLAAGLSQAYYVQASGPGGTSGYAAIVAATLPAPAPTNLRITGLTSTSISLAWDAPVGGFPVASYEILGWFNGYAAQYPLAYPNISGTSITITGLAPGNAMLWGVSALDTAGNVSAYDYLPSLVVNPVPHPAALSAVAMAASGTGFRFTVQPGAVQTTFIQATTNPSDPATWITIATNAVSGGPLIFTDTEAVLFPSRFYRVISP